MASSKVEEDVGGLEAVLEGVTVDSFPFTRTVQTIDGSQTIEAAFQLLAKHSISSVPVKQGDKYVGFVDISDLVAHVADMYRSLATTGAEPQNFTSLRSLLAAKSALISKPVDACVNLSKNNPFLPVPLGTPLKDVLVTLANSVDGASVHRVPVVDDAGNIVKIISQSAAVQFLFTHVEELGSVASSSLDTLGLARKPVVTVRCDEPALKAFELMAKHNLSGVAVQSPTGGILCSLSAADVRYMVAMDKFEIVGMDAISFVSKCRLMDARGMKRTMAPMVAVPPTASLASVIGKLAATRVHRLFVVEAGAVVGVVSLKDILCTLLPPPSSAKSIDDVIMD